jgi:signal transduction histidine kinase
MKYTRFSRRLKFRLFIILLLAGLVGITLEIDSVLLFLIRFLSERSLLPQPPGQGFYSFFPLRELVLIVLGTVTSLGIASYIMANYLVRPFNMLALKAQSILRGESIEENAEFSNPSEIHQVIDALNQMAKRAQAQVEEMRSFVANTSHELRTPLTSVKLRAEALRSGAVDDPVVANRYLSEIENEVDRLSQLVSDLLDLTKIEAGIAPTKMVALNFSQLLEEVCDTFKVRNERAGITLSYELGNGSYEVYGVEDQLRRVIYNLLDNAIKYTPRGGLVEVKLEANLAKEILRLAIKDTGFGIPAADLSLIFQRFYRVEATRPRYGVTRGSGLGLPIARSIVEAHKGKI